MSSKDLDGDPPKSAATPVYVVEHNAEGLDRERVARASANADLQGRMSIRDALRLYPHAVFWSVLLSLVTLMESYDYGLMGNFFGLPAFQKKYGHHLASGKYNVSAADQTVLKQVTKAGQVVGLLLTGSVVDRIGYKFTQLGALALLAPVILLQFMAPNKEALIAAQTLIGIPLAAFLTLANVYASEVAPMCLRPYLTTFTQICWVSGGLISTGILRGFVSDTTQWAYRIPFAIQWIWLPVFAVIVFLVPESPQWLVRKGHIERARASLRRLSGKFETEEDLEDRLAYIQYTNSIEAAVSNSVSYMECFRGVNLRRTEIACAVYATQPLCGYALATNTVYFLQQAGLSSANSFNISLGNQGLTLVCCFIAWALLRYCGRRVMIMWGLTACFISLILIGGLGIPASRSGTAWGTGACTYIFAVGYGLTLGPVPYLVITDVPSSRLRPKTVILARATYICATLLNVILTNYQINATAWAWRGKAGFFWAGSCALCILWAFFRLPETKDRLVSEIDVLFHNRVKAREFKSTRVAAVEGPVQSEIILGQM